MFSLAAPLRKNTNAENAIATIRKDSLADQESLLVLSPPVSTGHALRRHISPLSDMIRQSHEAHLVETRHGLISTADLDLVESGFFSLASSGRALNGRLVGVRPGLGTTKDVLALLFLKVSARVHGFLDGVLVWTCPAF